MTFKKENVTIKLAAQLKQLVKANARPLTVAGNISLKMSQVIGPNPTEYALTTAIIQSKMIQFTTPLWTAGEATGIKVPKDLSAS